MNCYPAACPSGLSPALRTVDAVWWEEGSGAGKEGEDGSSKAAFQLPLAVQG